MERFPAVLIGGPPHSGKSVLTYSLTQALRRRGVEHYVVRAAPDGEGDWANEAAQALVPEIRYKGPFGTEFTDFVCRSILGRHLPLLVDVGGRPTPYQEGILDCCTHAILLTPDEPAAHTWRALARSHGLPVIAELTSLLHGPEAVLDRGAVLRGSVAGLEWGTTASGPTFEALADRLASLLYYDPDELYRAHERLCPAEIVIHLGRLARTFRLPLAGEQPTWQPDRLADVLDYLPAAEPLGLYGRGPNWLYAAVALLAAPAPTYQFDVRLGWLSSLPLRQGDVDAGAPLRFRVRTTSDLVLVDASIPASYLDYDELPRLVAPVVEPERGVVIGGKLPLWLCTSLALTYRSAPWIAVYQPPLGGCVVVRSNVDNPHIGQVLALDPP